jgi:hypothetical protein
MLKKFLTWFWGGERKRMTCVKCNKASAPYMCVRIMFEGHSQFVSKMDKRHIGWVRYADEATMSPIAECPTCSIRRDT